MNIIPKIEIETYCQMFQATDFEAVLKLIEKRFLERYGIELIWTLEVTASESEKGFLLKVYISSEEFKSPLSHLDELEINFALDIVKLVFSHCEFFRIYQALDFIETVIN